MTALNSMEAPIREFDFTEDDFERVRKVLYDLAGISLSSVKRDMVYNRLVKRLRAYGLTRVTDYLNLLETPEHKHKETSNFINALTTNLTSFFREPHHFDYISALVVALLQKQSKVRIWSSACSIGEEPYSIAMSLYPYLTSPNQLEIVATDIDTNVLATAGAGIYESGRIDKLSAELVKANFLKGTDANQGLIKVKPHLRELIQFCPFNLIGEWPQREKFDIIFCRNVMIYFDKPTQKTLITKIAQSLNNYGHLLIGHSETLDKSNQQFDLVGQTIYRKRG